MLRERFWVLQRRETVTRIMKKCLVCCRHQARPVDPQPTPDSPKIRVDQAPPANTRLDFLDPLLIIIIQGLCLFSYMWRTIHLELSWALGTHKFLLSFRRFGSRRGLLSVLISDNAMTFKSASKEVERMCRSQEVHNFLVDWGVK